MYIIGLTGGIASGKSHASEVLRSLGADVLDADEIARGLTSPGGACAEAIQERFGTLDRRALGAIVFADEAARRELNAIVHPKVREAMLRAVEASKAPACVLDIPLLFESGMESLADEVWVVHVPKETQVRRVVKRDRLTEAEALARVDSQMPTDEKLARADEAIDASGDKAETRARIESLWRAALCRAETKP